MKKKIRRKRPYATPARRVPDIPFSPHMTVGILKSQLRRVPEDTLVYLTVGGPHVPIEHLSFYQTGHNNMPCLIVIGDESELPSSDPLEKLLRFVAQECTKYSEQLAENTRDKMRKKGRG
jgi:hypothetical protein